MVREILWAVVESVAGYPRRVPRFVLLAERYVKHPKDKLVTGFVERVEKSVKALCWFVAICEITEILVQLSVRDGLVDALVGFLDVAQKPRFQELQYIHQHDGGQLV